MCKITLPGRCIVIKLLIKCNRMCQCLTLTCLTHRTRLLSEVTVLQLMDCLDLSLSSDNGLDTCETTVWIGLFFSLCKTDYANK
jgi:hypothetical protein